MTNQARSFVCVLAMLLCCGLPAFAQNKSRTIDHHAEVRALERVRPSDRNDRQRLALAQAYYRDGRLDEAARESNAVLMQRPADASAWLILGEIARERGEWKQALAAFSRAARHAPARADIELRRGQALQELGRPREADLSFARYRILTQQRAEQGGGKK